MRRGFTLIEVMLVLLIAGLLAGAATLRLTHSLQQRTIEDVVEQVWQLDELARTRALRSGEPVVLHWDLERQIMWLGEEHTTAWAKTVFSKVKLTTVHVPRQRDTVIRYGSSALSNSFAVAIEDPTGNRRLLLVCGWSGQKQLVQDEKKALDILAQEKIGDDPR